MLGELFPGRKLQDEGGEDGEGQTHRDPWDIDLDSGVVRLRPMRPAVSKAAPKPEPKPEAVPASDPESGPNSESGPA